MSPSFKFTTPSIVFRISIDGYKVHQHCVQAEQRGIRQKISNISTGAGLHSFSFIEIKRSRSNPEYSGWELAYLLSEAKGEDSLDPYISDDRLKRIGTVLVEVYRYDAPQQTPTRMRAQSSYFKELQAQRKIPEEKLKELGLTSLTHSTRYSSFDSLPRKDWQPRMVKFYLSGL